MRIKVFCLFVVANTALAQVTSSVKVSTVVTGASPAPVMTMSIATHTPKPDGWDCVTYNISDYLEPPMPTGPLLDIYYDHSDKIYQECEDKLPKPFTSFPACTSMAAASWCAVRSHTTICRCCVNHTNSMQYVFFSKMSASLLSEGPLTKIPTPVCLQLSLAQACQPFVLIAVWHRLGGRCTAPDWLIFRSSAPGPGRERRRCCLEARSISTVQ